MKRHANAVALLAAGLALAVPAFAQGHGAGRQGGGDFGSHGNGGLGSGPSGNANAGSNHSSVNSSNDAGPKSAATLLGQNSHLEANLAKLFPTGTNLQTEASGFKNLGAFVSAVHVSHNLKIPFDQLKCTELGTTKAANLGVTCPTSVTNSSGMSLGKSIQTIKPDTNSSQAVRDANRETEVDLKETNT